MVAASSFFSGGIGFKDFLRRFYWGGLFFKCPSPPFSKRAGCVIFSLFVVLSARGSSV